MTPVLLLVHGWGFDRSFWAPLRAALAPRETLAWDLGFLGAPDQPAPPAGRPVVAVGHSFGLQWLAQHHPLDWRALVSINGFRRFAAAADFPEGVPPRLIDRMIARFEKTPEIVYHDFLARFGAVGAENRILSRRRLADGLVGLRQWDARERTVDLALAGRDDPLLSTKMTERDFAGTPIVWHDGGHLLAVEDPAWCAEQLGRFCDNLGGDRSGSDAGIGN